MSDTPATCPDCDRDDHLFDRRVFIKTTAAAGVAAASAGLVSRILAADTKKQKTTSETLATQLYKSLSDGQKEKCAFKFDDPLRLKVDNNWFITKAKVRDFTKDQQALIKDIFLRLHSDEYVERVMNQVEHDNKGGGGFANCAVALFGEPGSGKFEFVFTGRHVTRRCDGDSVEGAAFGGPIFYGHAAQGFNEAPDHPGNAYWYQAKRANELFQALDGKQRKVALIDNKPRGEDATNTVKLSGKKTDLAGIPVSDLSTDQKELAEKVLADVLAPFREVDRDECMKLIKAGGVDNLHLSYYKNMDIGKDGVWDVWQIEGPAMVWYFRGSPHVHTWVNIRQPA